MTKLQYKNGRYYYLKKKPSSRGYQWIGLSLDPEELTRQRRHLEAGGAIEEIAPPPGWLAPNVDLMHKRVRERAKAADIYCDLTRDDIRVLGTKTNWRCALTGIRFCQDRTANARSRALAPSVDRIDSSKGYTKENCRLVCVAVNCALNEWGELVFRRIAMAYCRHNKLQARPARLDIHQSFDSNPLTAKIMQ